MSCFKCLIKCTRRKVKEELHIQQELRNDTEKRTENFRLLLAWIIPILRGVIPEGIYGEL